jgi:site-specific DNA-methyltransferase (adenine-specific)
MTVLAEPTKARRQAPRKPYYIDRFVTLYHGDCLEILAQLPAQSVDLIFADPPYNLSNGGFTCHAGRMVPVHKGDWDKSRGLDADFAFTSKWLKACQRVLKPSGTLWVSGTQHVIFNVGFAMQKLGYHILNTITWFKPNASPNLSCRYFTHSNELLIWAAPARYGSLKHKFNYDDMRRRANGKQMRDVWELRSSGELVPKIFEIGPPRPEEKKFGKHPTQKPLELLNRIISASSDEGDLVLDPFNGSGTTAVMARALRRKYIGIELEKKYLDLTLKRLRALKPEQLTLLAGVDSP